MSWKTICWEAVLLGFLFSCTGSDKDLADRKLQIDYDYLKSNFQQPDRTYGVNCWWWWLNGNVTKEAITKDLEAMKSQNFQGAMILCGGHNSGGIRIFLPDRFSEVRNGRIFLSLLWMRPSV